MLVDFDEMDRLFEQRRSGNTSVASSNTVVIGQNTSYSTFIINAFEEEEEEIEPDIDDDGDIGDEHIVGNRKIESISQINKTTYFNPDLPYNPKTKNILSKIIADCLEEVHPGLWEVVEDGTKLHCAILFREINIQNSNRLTHKIEDLFVRFSFEFSNNRMYVGLYGRRGKYSPQEVLSDYAHSHLSGTCINGYSGFCLGSDYIIDRMRDCLIVNGNKEVFKRNFIAFLFQLNEYVAYESLEGRPYRYIRNIGIRRNESLDYREKEIDTLNIIKNMISTQYLPDYTFDINTGKVEFIDSENYENFLKSYSRNHQVKDRFGVFFTKGGTPNDIAIQNIFASSAPIQFRNQSFYPILSSVYRNDDSIDDSIKYCNREVKKQVEVIITASIKKNWLKETNELKIKKNESSINKRRSSKNNSRIPFESIRIVSEDQPD